MDRLAEICGGGEGEIEDPAEGGSGGEEEGSDGEYGGRKHCEFESGPGVS